jgi:hypothetical protein
MALAIASMRGAIEQGVRLLCAGVVCGCGNPSLAFIAGTSPGTGVDGGAVIVPTAVVRGRVRVAGTNLVTDKGTLLRGIDIPIDLTPDFPLSPELFRSMGAVEGLNMVQTYVEYWADATGANVAQADRIVAQAGAAGLYVVLGIGGGPAGNGHPGNGWFDINKVRSFWQFYAPRYKDQTHVIYQLQNQPDLSCDQAWPADTLAMEREAYSLVRSLAPETHIVMFSYRDMPTAALLGNNLDELAGVVDWSNASVGMGGMPNCVDTSQFPATFAAATSRRAPVFITAMALDGWTGSALELEKDRVGWTSIRWLVHMPDFGTFRAEHAQAGLTWCPDFGVWPQDSSTCGLR